MVLLKLITDCWKILNPDLRGKNFQENSNMTRKDSTMRKINGDKVSNQEKDRPS